MLAAFDAKNVKPFVFRIWMSLKLPELFSDNIFNYFLPSLFYSVTFILNPQTKTVRRVGMARFRCFDFNLCFLVYVLLTAFLNISILKAHLKNIWCKGIIL